MNFARDVVDAAPPGRRALVEIDARGARREFTFGEVADSAARLAGGLLSRGVARGDVVMTLIGNRPQWVLTMVACFASAPSRSRATSGCAPRTCATGWQPPARG